MLPPTPFPGGRPFGPAGEVPPNSRRAHDEGREPVPPRPGFSYAVPGVPGTTTQVQVVIPDDGAPTAGLSGGVTQRCIVLRIFRAKRALDGATAVRDALAGKGAVPAVTGPIATGGCGDAAGQHSPGPGLRTPPPAWVVRLGMDAGGIPEAERKLASIPGLERILEERLGGAQAGEVLLDVHIVEAR